MNYITLKSGKEKSLLRRHPWVFSGATSVPASIKPGDVVEVRSASGQVLAIAGASPQSQIVARVWSFDPKEVVDRDFFQRRIERAMAMRSSEMEPGCPHPGADGQPGVRTPRLQGESKTYATRLIFSESDGMPGFIADRYGDHVVLQVLSAGAEAWKETVADLLMAMLYPIKGVYERSDSSVRKKEGLPIVKGVLRGEAPPPTIEIHEGNVKILVDVFKGHKTGFYLDQRDNRELVGSLASGAEVLNCFCYTGGFGLHALRGGAKHVTQIDESADALELARLNTELNSFPADSTTLVRADVFRQLRQYNDEHRQFDLIILDPPKFIEAKSQIMKGARGYKDINRLAFQLVKPGGLLVTFSCSGLLETDLFQKIVADAALDAKREACVLRRLGQAADHPTLLSFPEATYLRGLVCRVG